MLKGLIDRYRTWRYGGVTGLNYVNANAKMTAVVTLPWLIGYLLCFMFVPDPFLEISIIMMSVVWIFYCYGLYAYAKVDATQYRAFPQSMWRFPDGGTGKYNLLIPPDGFTFINDFKDGTQGWRVNLGKRYQYWDKRMEFPFVFDYCLLRLLDVPDRCFSFLSQGEFFHKGIAIRVPACEDISVHIHEWLQDKDGQYFPVGEIRECTLRYKRALTLSTKKRKDPKTLYYEDLYGMAFLNERDQRMMIEQHALTLESMVDAKEKDARDFQKRVDDGIDKRRSLFKTIVDTEKPLVQRIKSSLKWIIIGLIGLFAFLWFIGVIRF